MGNLVDSPRISLNINRANGRSGLSSQKILVVGQMLPGGSATEGALIEDVSNDLSIISGLFSTRSHLFEVLEVIKEIAPMVQVDVIPFRAAPGATVASYTITLTGNATSSGTAELNVGGKKNGSLSVPVISGESPTAIAAKIANAINSDISTPFIASSSSGVLTITSTIAGTIGGYAPIGIRLRGGNGGLITGVSAAISTVSNGSVDPTEVATSAVFDVIGTNRYQAIVWPFDSLVAAEFQEARFNASNKIQDGIVFQEKVNTYANVLSFAGTLNQKSVVLVGDEHVTLSEYVGPANQESIHRQAAALAAVRALRLTPGASLSRYLTTSASSDQFGGPALSTLPYANTTIPQLSVTLSGQGFDETEMAALNAAGVTVMGTDRTGVNHAVGEVVTTNLTDSGGNSDDSFKYLNYFDAMSQAREYFFINMKKRFAQSRLTEGNALRGRDMVNKELFEAFADRLFGDLSSSEYVIAQAGEDALQYFKSNRFATLDLQTGTVSFDAALPINTQLRDVVGGLQISFSINEA